MFYLLLLLPLLSWGKVPFYDNALKTEVMVLSDAWYNLDRYMVGCLAESKVCGLEPEAIKILQKIYENYPTEVQKMVQLKSSKKFPGLFDLGHGTHRLAVTGNRVQDDISLNLDLVVDENTGAVLSKGDGISILVHELGHHTGVGDTTDRILDKIGLAVKTKFGENVQQIELSSIGAPFSGINIYNTFSYETLLANPSSAFHFPTISILGGWDSKDMDEAILEGITMEHKAACPTTQDIKLVYVENLRWNQISKAEKQVTAIADIKAVCGKSVASGKKVRAEFFYTAPLAQKNGLTIIDVQRGGLHVLTQTGSTTEAVGKIETISSNVKMLNNGGLWKLEAVVKAKNINVSGCEAFLSSDDILIAETGESVGVDMKCNLVQTATDVYKISMQHHFSPKFKSAKYYLKDVVLSSKNAKNDLWLKPAIRQIVDVKNPQSLKDTKVLGLKLFDKTGKDVSQVGIQRTGSKDSYTIETLLEGKVDDLYWGHLVLHGVDAGGLAFNGMEPYFNPNGSKLVKMTVTASGLNTILRVEIPDLDAYQDAFKSLNLESTLLIFNDMRSLRVTYPKTFRIK